VAGSAILGFWAVAALLIVVPGPDWAFAISAGLRGQVVPAATGIVIGYVAMTIVVAAGVGALVASSPVALTVLTVVGAAYLMRLGVFTVGHPAEPPGAQVAEQASRTPAATIAQGIGVSGLNPKALVIFLATLPQFTTPDAAWPIAGQMSALGIIWALTCAVVYLVVGASAGRILRSRPHTARVVSRVSGVCMIAVGAPLLVERFLI
jgi:threonine/homoserine/homoserine lactone efflux protein